MNEALPDRKPDVKDHIMTVLSATRINSDEKSDLIASISLPKAKLELISEFQQFKFRGWKD